MMVSGFIQAGGRSSRMGTDKAWLRLGELTLIERIIKAMEPAVSSLAIVANDAEKYSRLGLTVFADDYPGIGPLSGIYTALRNCATEYALVVACDLPFVTGELFSFLIASSEDYQAVVPLDRDGQLEPLCAVYARSCLSVARELIERGERRPRALFERVRTRFLDFQLLAHMPNADDFFVNLNTPEDYRRALQTLISEAE